MLKYVLSAFFLLFLMTGAVAQQAARTYTFTVSNTASQNYYQGDYKLKIIPLSGVTVSCEGGACPDILRAGESITFKIKVFGTENFAAFSFILKNPIMATMQGSVLDQLCGVPNQNYAILAFLYTIGTKGSAVLSEMPKGYPNNSFGSAAYCCQKLSICEKQVNMKLMPMR